MGTTQADIRGWLKAAPKDATHMLVVCDTFDYEDYPVYVLSGQDVYKEAKKQRGENMTKLMEVYNLSMDLEKQLIQVLAFNY